MEVMQAQALAVLVVLVAELELVATLEQEIHLLHLRRVEMAPLLLQDKEIMVVAMVLIMVEQVEAVARGLLE